MNNKEQAKKMFFDFACSHYFMWNDGAEKAYAKFNITKSQEEEWRREYISFWVSRLSADDLTALHKLSDAEATEALPDIMKMAQTGDSWSKFWYALNIKDLIADDVPLAVQKQAISLVIDILQSLVQSPIQLSADHRAEVDRTMMKALKASTPEGYVLNYAKNTLADSKVFARTIGLL